MVTIVFSVLLLWILFSALTAPLETLGWWAGWYTGEEGPPTLTTVQSTSLASVNLASASEAAETPAPSQLYIIYLTGIGGMEPNKHPPHEAHFLTVLAAHLPHATVIKDIFPYSATNEALTGNRIFSRFWRLMDRYKRSKGIAGLLGYIPNMRNLFQVIVSADKRYGPIYNYACANLIIAGLQRHGYRREAQTQIVLLGYSGGAQMAGGALGYLQQRLGVPISVISLAGIVSSTPGLKGVDHFYQLCSSKDFVEKLGPLIFPARWPLAFNSTWNQLKRAGKIEIKNMGAVTHEKQGSYLDPDSYLANGQSFLAHTVTTIVTLINRLESPQPQQNDLTPLAHGAMPTSRQ